MLTISSLATEQVQVPVTMRTSAGVGNPSVDTVQMAFLPGTANPASGDWKTAGWEQSPVGTWLAQCLVGPAGVITLTPGRYYVWVKILDPVETPVTQVGLLEVV